MCYIQNKNFPQCINDMINAEFKTGKGYDPSYRGYFCVDCGGKSLRKIDVESEHKGHKVLQALSCSREYGYNVNDVLKISDLLDVSGVCPYKVNTGFVYFPKSRKKKDVKKSNAVQCLVCGADLSKNARAGKDCFCSILCKLESGFESIQSKPLKFKIKIKRKIDEVVDETEVNQEEKKKRKVEEEPCCVLNLSKENEKEEGFESLITAAFGDGKKDGNATVSFRKRSRKGVPRRAPMSTYFDVL